jgi:dGTPase
VDVLEGDGRGLNLSWEVRDGIGRHSKGKNGSPVGLDPAKRAATLEGQVMRVADLIAYVNHDIDDAVRAGVLREEALPRGARERARRILVGAHRADGQGTSSRRPAGAVSPRSA